MLCLQIPHAVHAQIYKPPGSILAFGALHLVCKVSLQCRANSPSGRCLLRRALRLVIGLAFQQAHRSRPLVIFSHGLCCSSTLLLVREFSRRCLFTMFRTLKSWIWNMWTILDRGERQPSELQPVDDEPSNALYKYNHLLPYFSSFFPFSSAALTFISRP